MFSYGIAGRGNLYLKEKKFRKKCPKIMSIFSFISKSRKRRGKKRFFFTFFNGKLLWKPSHSIVGNIHTYVLRKKMLITRMILSKYCFKPNNHFLFCTSFFTNPMIERTKKKKRTHTKCLKHPQFHKPTPPPPTNQPTNQPTMLIYEMKWNSYSVVCVLILCPTHGM